ncbi:PAS domain S-box protein, partial [Candidatus Ozemobacteraceae bacterium]|nr:PAS domain S-box protein [Candidatus Ozemobacteraceae bacterium]
MNNVESRLTRTYADRFLGTLLIFSGIGIPFSLSRMSVTGFQLGTLSQPIFTAVLAALYVYRGRIEPARLFKLSLGTLIAILPLGFIQMGPLSTNMIMAPFIPILARIVLGGRAAKIGLGYIVLVIGAFAFLFCSNTLSVAFDPIAFTKAPSVWLFNLYMIVLGTIAFMVMYSPAEVVIMEKQEWFSTIFNGVNDAILIRDANTGALLDINNRVTELFGYTREEAFSLPVAFLDPNTSSEARADIENRFRNLIQLGGSTFDHWLVRRKDGTELIVEGEFRRLRIGESDVVISTLRDVTTRKKAEEALRESENKYRQVFEMESDAHFIIDKETGQILEVNSAACSMYGFSREELLQKTNTDLSAEPSKTTHQTKTEGTLIPVRLHKKANGTVFPVEITAGHFTLNGRRVHLAAIRDISFRQKLEEQLLQAKKMESIGRLAGGISHDFNNLLSPIMGFSELMLKCETVDPHHRDWLKAIRKAAERARDLTRQLLAFGRKQVLLLKPVSLESVLKEIEQILRRTIREDIHIEIEIQPRVGIVKADVGQIEQILMNLALNAQDAMPKGGTLRISLSETMFRPTGSDESGDIPEKPHAMLTINDTGCGMSPDVIQHLFEPFFTTKEKGKGTGLGLSMVYGIVKQHEGHIMADS